MPLVIWRVFCQQNGLIKRQFFFRYNSLKAFLVFLAIETLWSLKFFWPLKTSGKIFFCKCTLEVILLATTKYFLSLAILCNRDGIHDFPSAFFSVFFNSTLGHSGGHQYYFCLFQRRMRTPTKYLLFLIFDNTIGVVVDRECKVEHSF